MKYLFILIALILSVNSYAEKTTAITNGDWNVASSWDNGIPTVFTDTIYIPSSYTITLTDHVDLSTGSTKPIYIVIDGTIVLGNDGGFLLPIFYELSLPSGSAISMSSTGSLVGGEGGWFIFKDQNLTFDIDIYNVY